MAIKFNPRYYRLRFLSSAAEYLVLPPLLLSFAFNLVDHRIPRSLLYRALAYIITIPLHAYVRGYISHLYSTKAARRNDAVLVPCVKGRWPGNVDILWKFLRGIENEYIMQAMKDLFEEYGCLTLNTRILWLDQIITIDENIVGYMLTGQGFQLFGKGYLWQERFETFLGNGIFNRDGEEWKTHRAIARPYFVKERIADTVIISSYSNRVLEIISSHLSSSPNILNNDPKLSNALDIQDIFHRFSMDVSTAFLYGSQNATRSLSLPLPKAGKARIGPKGSLPSPEQKTPSTSSHCAGDLDKHAQFVRALEAVQVRMTMRTFSGKNWPLAEMFRDSMQEGVKVMRDAVDPLIESVLRSKRQKGVGNGSEKREDTFLEHLARGTDDKDFIRNEMFNLLLAGRDTTASLLTMAIYFMALHPDLCETLREEVLKTHGHEENPTYESIKGMPYLQAWLNETMRLIPPVPVNAKSPLRGGTTVPAPGGRKYYIPAETEVVYFKVWMQRRKDLWGEDADEFKPERWLDDSDEGLKERGEAKASSSLRRRPESPWAFIPFHAGPRICLGQNFALHEASHLIIRLLQRYKNVELVPEAAPEGTLPPPRWREEGRKGRQTIEKCWVGASVTSYIKGGLWVRFNLA